MVEEKFNLFVYGSLRDPIIFESVSGIGFSTKPETENTEEEKLKAEPAFLGKHRKVSPDNVYFYAVPSETNWIEGFIIYDIPAKPMAEIDWYEGRRYSRETVKVSTADKRVEALAYLASPKSMKEDFGDRWHVNLIEELWLRKRIEGFIEKKTRPGDTTDDAKFERIAERELLGTTERDIVISQYRRDTFSDFFIEQEINKPRPSIRHLYNNKNALSYLNNYFRLVVKYVLLNRFEEKIREKYRFRLEHIRTSRRYFKRSVSLLAAIRMINASRDSVNIIVERAINTIDYRNSDLIDYVKYAVGAANGIFEARIAKNQLNQIAASRQPGIMPLGAEIELSNLGHKTIALQNSDNYQNDPIYDGFKYFHDFHLDILTWKLGGCIDDHSGITTRAQQRGFLEFAPGRLNIAGELSRPTTADPWILNQLINHITRFHDIAPHSLHLSFQMRKGQIGKQEIMPIGFVKCLLVLGGGLEEKVKGRIWVSRLSRDEIVQDNRGEELAFSLTSKRKWYLGEDDFGAKEPSHSTTQVYQYKFIRLDRRANYEPLILCLKGLQIAFNPADYLTYEQLKNSRNLRKDYRQLKEWADAPTPISGQVIKRFLTTVRDGLMHEAHGSPAHKLHYINWAINSITVQLRMFNKLLKTGLK